MEDIYPWQKYFFEDTAGSLLVPEYIAWDFPINKEDILSPIRSKNKRKFLRKVPLLLDQYQITVKYACLQNQAEYNQLLEFFFTTHREKQHAIARPTANWLENKTLQGRTAESLQLFCENHLIAMKMYSYDDAGFYFSHKASQREWDERVNVGLILDYLSFQRANELGYQEVYTGKGKNFFGDESGLSLELFGYKSSMGFKVRTAKESKVFRWQLSPGLAEKITSPFLFLAQSSRGEKVFYISPQVTEDLEQIKMSMSPINVPLEALSANDFRKIYGK